MTALEFYRRYQVEGRALLTPDPPATFYGFVHSSGRAPATRAPTSWLIRAYGRLLLIVDDKDPVRRMVADNAPVRPLRDVGKTRYVV